MEENKIGAIVLAGGRGSRMRSAVPKQYLDVGGRPVLYYSLAAFQKSPVDKIILVCGSGQEDYCRRQIVDKYHLTKVEAIVEGGDQRYNSVENGLRALTGCGIVLIHDGARPMVNDAIIRDNIEAVKEYGACVTAVPSKDTIKMSDEDGFAASTPDRSRMWIVQTPQSFNYNLIRAAYEARRAADDGTLTDDAMAVEKYMHTRVKLVMGDYRNIKITTPEDLGSAEIFLGK